MTVKQLKDQLEIKGLKVSGKKEELVARLSNSDTESDTESESDEINYNTWTVKKIREELKTRGLKARKGDKKIDLVNILEEDDNDTHRLSSPTVNDSDEDTESESDIESDTE